MSDSNHLRPGDTIRASTQLAAFFPVTLDTLVNGRLSIKSSDWSYCGESADSVAVVISTEEIVGNKARLVTLFCLESGQLRCCWNNQIRSAEIVTL